MLEHESRGQLATCESFQWDPMGLTDHEGLLTSAPVGKMGILLPERHDTL